MHLCKYISVMVLERHPGLLLLVHRCPAYTAKGICWYILPFEHHLISQHTDIYIKLLKIACPSYINTWSKGIR